MSSCSIVINQRVQSHKPKKKNPNKVTTTGNQDTVTLSRQDKAQKYFYNLWLLVMKIGFGSSFPQWNQNQANISWSRQPYCSSHNLPICMLNSFEVVDSWAILFLGLKTNNSTLIKQLSYQITQLFVLFLTLNGSENKQFQYWNCRGFSKATLFIPLRFVLPCLSTKHHLV